MYTSIYFCIISTSIIIISIVQLYKYIIEYSRIEIGIISFFFCCCVRQKDRDSKKERERPEEREKNKNIYIYIFLLYMEYIYYYISYISYFLQCCIFIQNIHYILQEGCYYIYTIYETRTSISASIIITSIYKSKYIGICTTAVRHTTKSTPHKHTTKIKINIKHI